MSHLYSYFKELIHKKTPVPRWLTRNSEILPAWRIHKTPPKVSHRKPEVSAQFLSPSYFIFPLSRLILSHPPYERLMSILWEKQVRWRCLDVSEDILHPFLFWSSAKYYSYAIQEVTTHWSFMNKAVYKEMLFY